MEYFKEPVTAVFMRNVSQKVVSFSLTKNNEEKTAKIKTMRYSNENVAHEMSTPLRSIIIVINLLLALEVSERDRRRVTKYYDQIKSQAYLLLHFVNDLLDYRLFKKEKFELNLLCFAPKTAVESIIGIFKLQARS